MDVYILETVPCNVSLEEPPARRRRLEGVHPAGPDAAGRTERHVSMMGAHIPDDVTLSEEARDRLHLVRGAFPAPISAPIARETPTQPRVHSRPNSDGDASHERVREAFHSAGHPNPTEGSAKSMAHRHGVEDAPEVLGPQRRVPSGAPCEFVTRPGSEVSEDPRNVVAYIFLGLKGLRIVAQESDVVSLMLSVASGTAPESELADWIRSNTAPR